ncbi:MAG TPA: MBL fold metallo-hydrolase [Propionibacteriaceae bacterium]|nr:MBL fold metallo-hydrolase [Propionibacteriaceae bacterium]
MLIVPAAVGPWQANCYLVAAGAGRPDHPAECLVIDPGMGARPVVDAACERYHLRVAGVVGTHGHLDHIADATAVADAAGVPVYIHPDDEHLLTRPLEGLSGDAVPLVRQFGLERLPAPRWTGYLTDGLSLELAGVRLDLRHAPGHTPGCVLLTLDGVRLGDEEEPRAVVFTGDVVFAGSIGRMDLPGGDAAVMRHTLDTVVQALPDAAYLLPGHGPATTMAVERASNPYLSPNAAPLS